MYASAGSRKSLYTQKLGILSEKYNSINRFTTLVYLCKSVHTCKEYISVLIWI